VKFDVDKSIAGETTEFEQTHLVPGLDFRSSWPESILRDLKINADFNKQPKFFNFQVLPEHKLADKR